MPKRKEERKLNSDKNGRSPSGVSPKRPVRPNNNPSSPPPRQKRPPSPDQAKRTPPHEGASQPPRPPQGPRRPQPERAPLPQKKRSDLADNLRSQTPLSRQLRKKQVGSEPGTVRRTSAPQYFKIRQEGEPKKARRKKEKRKGLSFGSKVLVLGIVGYLVLLPVVILIASLTLPMHSLAKTEDVRYQLGPNDDVVSRKYYPFSRVYRGGIYYIEMDSLAEYCTFTTTGDSKIMRYVIRDTSEAVEFHIGESIAYVNGVPERTGGDSFIASGKVYIPLEFAQRCFVNLEISLDTEKNRITIVRLTDEKENYLPISFPHKLPTTTERINFAALDVEIQEEIIKQNQPVLPTPPADGDTNDNN